MAVTATQRSDGGFWNLLARENRVWWAGRRWLMQAAAGLGVVGFLAFAMLVLPGVVEAAGESIDILEVGSQMFFGLGLFAFAIDIIILTQNTIVGEKQSGVAEWVLSKPVSRSSYIMAKLLSNMLGVFVTLILLPGAAAFGVFALVGAAVPPGTFAAAMAIVFLHTVFYLALSLMMGVLAENQGAVLAVTLGSLLGGAVLSDFVGRVAVATPWMLGNLAVGLVQGMELPPLMWVSVGATTLLTLLAVIVAIWRFESAEL